MGDKTLLLTGGAGYIGSHVARDLVNEGYEVIILDDLSRGFAAATLNCELVRGDVGDKVLLTSLLNKHRVQAVLHFAGFHHRAGVRREAADVLREQYRQVPQSYGSQCGMRCQSLHILFQRRRLRHPGDRPGNT